MGCEIDTLQMECTDVHVNKVKIYNYLIAFHPCFNICNNAIKTMAPHGKELTAEQKEIIISLSDNGRKQKTNIKRLNK